MKAQETKLKFLLEGKRQYVIPLYQRRYAWTEREWRAFWMAVTRQHDLVSGGEEARPTHFFGSIVVHPSIAYSSGVATYNVIDGQQRLTSVFSLLIAIRDSWSDGEEQQRIDESYLLNKWEKGDNRYKMLPGWHDRADMIALIDRKHSSAVGAVGGAYRWFLNEIKVLKAKRGELDLVALESTVISRLEVVDITADASDNAHRIFQTLNSTGRGLSQVDLLRNHFFMLLPNEADQAYQEFWAPMESALGTSFDLFLWVETVSRGGGRESVPRDQVYAQWQSDLAAVEQDEAAVVRELERLHRRSEAYAVILDPTLLPAGAVRDRLSRLSEWGSSVHQPVTLQVVARFQSGEASEDSAAASLLLVESFMVRRMLAGVPTNNLNRIFTTTAGQIHGKSDLRAAVHRALSTSGKYWPSDFDVLEGVIHEQFYLLQRSAQRQFVLRRLEEALAQGEHPDWQAASYTLEHVMPQHLNQAWIEVLVGAGETDAVAAHAELLHVLGNITLTTKNSTLSDSPFKRKQEILESSFLTLNKKINDFDSWDRDAIEQRGRDLGRVALALWPAPLAPEEVDEPDEWQLVLPAVLGFLPAGSWVAIEDLADLAGAEPNSVRQFLISERVSGQDRVLNPDGTVDVTLPWVADDLDSYRTRLVSLGILGATTDPHAPLDQRASSEVLAQLSNGG